MVFGLEGLSSRTDGCRRLNCSIIWLRLLGPSGIKVTRIARGVPVGVISEYADELT